MFRNKSTLQTIHRIRTELSLGVLGFYSTHFESANEWVVSNQILVFAQRFLGLPWDKHCKLLEGNNYMVKGCFEVQKNDFGDRSTLLSQIFIRNGLR